MFNQTKKKEQQKKLLLEQSLLSTYAPHKQKVTSISWCGNTIATASLDQTIYLRNTIDDSNDSIYYGHTAALNTVIQLDGGQNIASAGDIEKSGHAEIHFWDRITQRKIKVFQHHTAVRQITWHPAGIFLIDHDGRILGWGFEQNRVIWGWDRGPGLFSAAVLSPNALCLVTGSSNEEYIDMYGALKGGNAFRSLYNCRRHILGSAIDFTWAASNNVLCVLSSTISNSKYLTLLRVNVDYDKILICNEIACIYTPGIEAISWSTDNNYIALLDPIGKTVFINEVQALLKYQNWGVSIPHESVVNCMTWSDDSHKIAVGCIDGTVSIWDIQKLMQKS